MQALGSKKSTGFASRKATKAAKKAWDAKMAEQAEAASKLMWQLAHR